MQKRVCPVCGLPQYSAAAEGIWHCPRCGAEIPAGEHHICTGCKKQSVFFEEFCEGLRGEWTLGKCEAARAEARKRWREKEAARMGQR